MSGKAAKRTRGARDGERRRAWPTALLPWAIVAVSVLVSAGVAGAVMLTRTAAGREMVLDWALSRLRPAINGSIRVGSVAPGGLLTGATLHDLEISDSLGRPVLVADSIRARYSILELLAGTSGVADVHIWSPTLTLDHAPGDRVDLSSLLTGTDSAPDAASGRRGEGDAPGFRIRGARIHAGTVTMLDDDGTERRIDRISAAFPRIDIRPGQGVDLTASLEDVALSYPLGGGRLDLAGIQGVLEVGAGGISVTADRFSSPGVGGKGAPARRAARRKMVHHLRPGLLAPLPCRLELARREARFRRRPRRCAHPGRPRRGADRRDRWPRGGRPGTICAFRRRVVGGHHPLPQPSHRAGDAGHVGAGPMAGLARARLRCTVGRCPVRRRARAPRDLRRAGAGA